MIWPFGNFLVLGIFVGLMTSTIINDRFENARHVKTDDQLCLHKGQPSSLHSLILDWECPKQNLISFFCYVGIAQSDRSLCKLWTLGSLIPPLLDAWFTTIFGSDGWGNISKKYKIQISKKANMDTGCTQKQRPTKQRPTKSNLTKRLPPWLLNDPYHTPKPPC